MPRRFLELLSLESRLVPATWDGGGADNNWTTPENWVGDIAPIPNEDLTFPAGADRLASVNDYTDNTTFNSVALLDSDYQITGNAMNVRINVLAATAGTQSIGLPINGPATMTKIGPGLLMLNGTNAFTGQFNIEEGHVILGGSLTAPIVVAGGVAGGSGALGDLRAAGGTVDPGFAAVDQFISVMTTQNVSIDGGTFPGTYLVNVGNTPAGGLDSDRLVATGTVQLGGKLIANADSFMVPGPLNFGTVTIIDNDGTDPVFGEFDGLPEGAIINDIGDKAGRISYVGGDGNDVTLTIVEPIATPSFSVGAGAGGGPQVNVYFRDGTLVRAFNAYDISFRGGVRVATADINRDGIKDIITAPGPGGGPHIRVFDGFSGAVIREFLAYDPAFTGGVFVAAGDVNGDGFIDIVTGAGAGGGPHVKAFSGVNGSLLTEFLAYDPAFTGGVSVAAGDTTGDGFAEIITGAGLGGGPHVRVFDAINRIDIGNFFAYDAGFRGGVNVAFFPVMIGTPRIVTTSGFGMPPEVRVYSASGFGEIERFNAYDPAFIGGISVAVAPIGPVNSTAIITGPGAGGGPHIKGQVPTTGNPPTLTLNFLAFDPAFLGGVYVG